MNDLFEEKAELLELVNAYQNKYELSKTIDEDYFEPGMMENLDQYIGVYDESTNTIKVRLDVKGLRYDNRTQRIDDMEISEPVIIERDEANSYNSNNFYVKKENNEDIGNLPAEFCNVLAPLYDMGYARIEKSAVSYIEKLSDRSRYARQGVMFLEIQIKLIGI